MLLSAKRKDWYIAFPWAGHNNNVLKNVQFYLKNAFVVLQIVIFCQDCGFGATGIKGNNSLQRVLINSLYFPAHIRALKVDISKQQTTSNVNIYPHKL